MSFGDNWAEDHGYTVKCVCCGQTCDSDFCSVRCERDYISMGKEDRERLDAEEENDDIEPDGWEPEEDGPDEEEIEEEIMDHLDGLP